VIDRIHCGVIGEREYNYARNNPIFYIDVSGLECTPPPCETPKEYPECNARCNGIYSNGLACCFANYKSHGKFAKCVMEWDIWLKKCIRDAPVDCPGKRQ
jgi:hypothetical protein